MSGVRSKGRGDYGLKMRMGKCKIDSNPNVNKWWVVRRLFEASAQGPDPLVGQGGNPEAALDNPMDRFKGVHRTRVD